MSKSVDERVVEMQFDNKQFESGIKTSLNSLDNLKKGLNFDAASKSLTKLEQRGRTFSLAGIERGVDLISSRFTNLGIVGVTALQNIANAAIRTGTNLVKALTIDPVLTGFQEYETKMNAITTILTNTESKGSTLEDVNRVLNELNTYADKTIYNFAEMTKNIGTFTAAGVDLETSAKAIQGIANLAAGSGSTSAQASTAMYQLSQAIAAGRVSLQDWNSVVNAGMGGELFQNALKETAKQMGIVVDESVSFRDSISATGGKSSWLTSDVLVKTLEKFADDQTLLKAATQVKTFTQLIDTMKESVQSGWAQSWEYIIGDREQAAELFTAMSDGFNSIIQPSTDARNAALQFWNANGGREAVLKGLSNILKTFGDVLKPIGEAFDEAFPPLTGQRLTDISKKFLNLTESFKIGNTTAKNIRNTFSGFLSVIQLFGKGVSAVLKPVLKLMDGIGTIGGVILSVTGSVGEFLTELNKSKSINEAMDTISDSLGTGTNAINKFIDSIFTDKGSINSLLDSFAEGASTILEGVVSKVADTVKWISEHISIGDVFAGLAGGGIFMVAKKVADIFGTIKDALDNFLGNTEKIRKIKDNFSDILSSVHDSIESFTSGIKTVSLLAIAGAIGILSASLNSISKLKVADISKSLFAIGILMTELNLSFRSINKTLKKFDSKGILKSSVSMIAIATAIKILASAMKDLGSLDMAGIGKGLAGIGGMLAELSLFFKATDLKKVSIKGSLGLIAIAEAINILADAVDKFSGLSWKEIERGLTAMGVGLGELVAAIKIIGKSKVSVSTSVAILVLAESCKTLAEALGSFGSMKWKTIEKGLTAMGLALGELVVSVSVLGKFGGVGSLLGSGAIYVITQSLEDIYKSLRKFGSMKWDEIGKGLVAMGGALLELGTVSGALGKIAGFSGLLGSGSILIAAQSLEPIAKTFQKISSLSWEEIGKGLVAMGGALGELGLVSGVLGGLTGLSGILGGGAILIAVQSLEPISQALNSISKLSWEEIAKGLVGMGVAFGELALIVGTLGSVSPIGGILGSGAILLGVQSLDDIAKAMQSFGSMEWNEIAKGLVGMGGALAELAIITGLLGSLAPLGGLIGGGSILLGVQGLGQLADALAKFGSMSWDEIGKGLAAMGGALGETALGGFLNTLSGIGALSISEMAPALGVLADSLSKWKNVSVPDGLGEQLGTLASGVMKFTFGGFGANALSSAAPGLGDMATAVKKWNGVEIPSGIKSGLTGIADGVNSFTWAFVGGWSIGEIVSPLKSLATAVKKWNGIKIPKGIKTGLSGLADGVKSFTWAFAGGWSIGEIAEPLKDLGSAVRWWSNITIPEGIGSSLSGLANGVKAFNEAGYAGMSLSSIGSGLMSLGTAVNGLAGIDFVSVSSGLVVFANSVKNIPNELSGVAAAIQASASGIVIAISSQTGPVMNAFSVLISSGAVAIRSQSGILNNAGRSVAISFAQTLSTSFSSSAMIAQAGITNMFNTVLNSAQNIVKNSQTRFRNEGSSVIQAFINGMNARKGSVNSAVSSIASSVASAFNSKYWDFYNAGGYCIQGLAKGMTDHRSTAINAAVKVAADSYEAAKHELDVNSPSKKYEWLGEESDNGLAKGLIGKLSAVTSASKTVGRTMLKVTEESLSRIPAILDEDLELTPRITPVLDLSNVSRNARSMRTMLHLNDTTYRSSLVNSRDVQTAGRARYESARQTENAPSTVENNYNQYITSPKPLSRLDIYRQSKNLFALEKGGNKTK